MDVDAPSSSVPSASAEPAAMEQDNPQPQPPEMDEYAAFWAKADALGIKPEQMCYYVRHHSSVPIVDPTAHQVYYLRWKTFKKDARKGCELDPRWFDQAERAKFANSDAKEWQSFLETGAITVIPPRQAAKIPKDRIFIAPLRFVRTNKDKSGDDAYLEAKSRLVIPGHVDPDGDIPVEDGGFRTDAPTAPQLAFHLMCSFAARYRWRLKTFDCKTAFLTGKSHDRDIYVRLPKEGLPGVENGSLIKLIKGAYGLREAPRLWHLKAKETVEKAGFEELRTGRGAFHRP